MESAAIFKPTASSRYFYTIESDPRGGTATTTRPRGLPAGAVATATMTVAVQGPPRQPRPPGKRRSGPRCSGTAFRQWSFPYFVLDFGFKFPPFFVPEVGRFPCPGYLWSPAQVSRNLFVMNMYFRLQNFRSNPAHSTDNSIANAGSNWSSEKAALAAVG